MNCAILAGLFFRKIEATMPQQQEAIIEVSFVFAASLALLFLADHPHGDEAIRQLLSGQILFVTWDKVLAHAPIYGLIGVLWFYRPSLRSGIGFYLLFALAITSSVQLVGVYVVFASLILPALATVKAKHPYSVAWLCGLVAVVAETIIAVWIDLPVGPILVVSFTITAVLLFTLQRWTQLTGRPTFI